MLIKILIDFFNDKKYRKLTLATIVTLANGTIVYHFVEGWKWLDSLYFSVITLTTVGYGDFSPQTPLGKVFTIVYIVTGLGIIFGFIDAIYKHRQDREKNRQNSLKNHINRLKKK